MSRPVFQFGNVVVVEGNLIGVIVKSWGPIMRGGIQTDKYEHEVYVRSFNNIITYPEEVIAHFVYDKELTEEDMEYQEL